MIPNWIFNPQRIPAQRLDVVEAFSKASTKFPSTFRHIFTCYDSVCESKQKLIHICQPIIIEQRISNFWLTEHYNCPEEVESRKENIDDRLFVEQFPIRAEYLSGCISKSITKNHNRSRPSIINIEFSSERKSWKQHECLYIIQQNNGIARIYLLMSLQHMLKVAHFLRLECISIDITIQLLNRLILLLTRVKFMRLNQLFVCFAHKELDIHQQIGKVDQYSDAHVDNYGCCVTRLSSENCENNDPYYSRQQHTQSRPDRKDRYHISRQEVDDRKEAQLGDVSSCSDTPAEYHTYNIPCGRIIKGDAHHQHCDNRDVRDDQPKGYHLFVGEHLLHLIVDQADHHVGYEEGDWEVGGYVSAWELVFEEVEG